MPLRIALVSYEYSGGADGGGIGTYVRNAATMLSEMGHSVEVFTSGRMEGRERAAGVEVHTTRSSREEFPLRVRAPFAARHKADQFDVVEGPEYGADASAINEAFPELALVVRLHTPRCLIEAINHSYMPWSAKVRFVGGGLRRGRIPRLFWNYDPLTDLERAHALKADVVVGPSRAIIDRLRRVWRAPHMTAVHIPNVFIPSKALVELDPNVMTNRIVFIGRLEARKGVIELARAIPKIVADVPEARFRFVGASGPHPATSEDLKHHVRRTLAGYETHVEFHEAVPYNEVPRVFCETDICVLPSIWENFPNACLEAMAAARGVVGSSEGGMAEIIQHERTGMLVPPRDPDAIADAVVRLLKEPTRRIAMARAARERVRDAYSYGRIAPLQETAYARAIQLSRLRNQNGLAH